AAEIAKAEPVEGGRGKVPEAKVPGVVGKFTSDSGVHRIFRNTDGTYSLENFKNEGGEEGKGPDRKITLEEMRKDVKGVEFDDPKEGQTPVASGTDAGRGVDGQKPDPKLAQVPKPDPKQEQGQTPDLNTLREVPKDWVEGDKIGDLTPYYTDGSRKQF